MLYYLARLFGYSTLAIAALGSQETQTPLHSLRPEVRYVECSSRILTGRIYDCGQIDVPIDWDDPGRGSITLNFTALVVKRRIPRKGALFYHSGFEYLGRNFDTETGVNYMMREPQLGSIVSEYDIVTWSSRESAIAERARCFASDDTWSSRSRSPFGVRENEVVAFYNATFVNDLDREPPWDDHMTWSHTQGPGDVKDTLYAHQKLFRYCLDASPDRDLFKYVGTAASARDVAAIADALDGPGSNINLWTRHHGSVLASHILHMFPERIGRVVMDDPVDPISYQEKEAYKRWAMEIATANNSLAHTQLHEMKNGSLGFMQFSGHPPIDEARMEQMIEFLHAELIEWHTRADMDAHIIAESKKSDLWKFSMDIPNFIFYDVRQSRGINSWRGRLYRNWRTMSLLDGVPLVCGDSLSDYDTDMTTMRKVEKSIIDSMYIAPLITSSAFPPLRYLCHLWPVRASQRIPLGVPYRPLSDNSKLLVLIRMQDYWNYFSVSEELARERWPTASVVGGLHYGDLAFDHDECSANIVKSFLKEGLVPEGPELCPYEL